MLGLEIQNKDRLPSETAEWIVRSFCSMTLKLSDFGRQQVLSLVGDTASVVQIGRQHFVT